MKNTYTSPVVSFESVEIKDIITTSLTNGGDEGGVFNTVDVESLFN